MLKKLTSWFAGFALALVCLASFSLMFWASRTDSAIDDELAHIPAGYGYVHNLDYRLNPEHPPLIKALAMLPVLFLNPEFPTASAAWQDQINSQWVVGTKFLYTEGNNANQIIMTARIMPMIITIITVILVFFLAAEIVGPLWALLPAFLFAFDPTVLANGHYVTTDVGAAFGVVLSLLFFLRYIDQPSTKRLWWAGIAFGIAQITKFSTPLLIPLYLFLMIVMAGRDITVRWRTTDASRRVKAFFSQLGRNLWRLILICAIGYLLIVYPAYFLFTLHYPIAKQVSDTTQILNSFATGPTPAGHICNGMRCIADFDIWMAKSPVLRPFAHYLLGILMALQRVDGGNTIYFLGQIRGSGGWIYFPVLFLLKEPIPTLIIVLGGLLLALSWIIRRAIAVRGRILRPILEYLQGSFAEFSLATFIVMYWGYSMHSPLNIGLRHVMPTIPLIFILAGVVWKKWVMKFELPFLDTIRPEKTIAAFMNPVATIGKTFLWSAVKYIGLIILLIWLGLETLFAAPYFLSYYNEIGGGVWGGYHFVTDSNYDWGQDLLRLQSFVQTHPEIDKIAVDYFGGGDPSYYLGTKEVNWSSSKGNPADQGIHWLAVSVNTLEGATQPLAPGQTRNASDTYSWLTALRPPQDASGTWLGGDMGNVPMPDYRAGTSIFIYHLQ